MGRLASTKRLASAAGKASQREALLVDVEIVLDQNDRLDVGEVNIGQLLQDVRIVHGGVTIRDFDMAPACGTVRRTRGRLHEWPSVSLGATFCDLGHGPLKDGG